MTCKNCVNHDKCKKQDKLMFTIDDICELIYQHGVEKVALTLKRVKRFARIALTMVSV